ncbi:MAG: T9SS type A sorting domain-containing protein, partial [Nonlabens ulvanivorans]
KYTVSARCKILPSNEYGDWTHKSVWVGSPEFGTNSIQGDDEVNVGNFEYYTAPSATNNPSYNWTYTYPGSSCSWKILNNNSKKLYAQAECDGQGWLTVTASNACGSVSLDKYVEILGGSGGGGGNPCGTAPMMVKAFPNPSKDGFITLKKIDDGPGDPCDGGGGPEMPASIEQPDEEIKIYDFNGALIFSRKISPKDGTIENVNLKSGNYIIKTGHDAGSVKQELLIVE